MNQQAKQRPQLALFDMMLLGFFELWRQSAKQHRDRLELEDIHWLEDFCGYVWRRLEKFEDAGMLKEPLRPR